jgi:hypothetical protein
MLEHMLNEIEEKVKPTDLLAATSIIPSDFPYKYEKSTDMMRNYTT